MNDETQFNYYDSNLASSGNNGVLKFTSTNYDAQISDSDSGSLPEINYNIIQILKSLEDVNLNETESVVCGFINNFNSGINKYKTIANFRTSILHDMENKTNTYDEANVELTRINNDIIEFNKIITDISNAPFENNVLIQNSDIIRAEFNRMSDFYMTSLRETKKLIEQKLVERKLHGETNTGESFQVNSKQIMMIIGVILLLIILIYAVKYSISVLELFNETPSTSEDI
jgi:hypothetical protein